VTLSVRDTGIGMEPRMMERVLEPFVQADRSLERSRGGLGLGLSLAKGLVALHSGRIRALSDGPGRGSEIEIQAGFDLHLTKPAELAEVERILRELGDGGEV
jgi:signal transduction histidine kinase